MFRSEETCESTSQNHPATGASSQSLAVKPLLRSAVDSARADSRSREYRNHLRSPRSPRSMAAQKEERESPPEQKRPPSAWAARLGTSSLLGDDVAAGDTVKVRLQLRHVVARNPHWIGKQVRVAGVNRSSLAARAIYDSSQPMPPSVARSQTQLR